jgi:hypothetical protein
MTTVNPILPPIADSGFSDTKRTELMQIAAAIELVASGPPSSVVKISQAAIDRLAQDVGAL